MFFCIVCNAICTHGQSLIQGKIIDYQTKAILQGALVVHEGNPVAVSDKNGGFRFVLMAGRKKEITVKYIGYETIQYPVSNKEYFLIEMIPSASDLKDVTVYSGAEKIIQKAIQKIKENYPQKRFAQTGLLKFLAIQEETNPLAFRRADVEATIKIHYTPYTAKYIQPDIILIENRNRSTKSINATKDSFVLSMNWYHPGLLDFVHTRSSFLYPYFGRKYNFTLLEKTWYNGHRIFSIWFESKKKNKEEGLIYIDTATYAFMRMYATSFNKKKLFTRTITKGVYEINYTCTGNKWYMNNYEAYVEYKLQNNNPNAQGYTTFRVIKNDTLDVYPPEKTNSFTEYANAMEINKMISDSSWKQYDTLFAKMPSPETISLTGAYPDTVRMADTSGVISKHASKQHLNRFFTNNYRIGIIISNMNISAAGYQPFLNKTISETSSFGIGSFSNIRLYKNLSINFNILMGFARGLNINQITLAFSNRFLVNHIFYIEPSLGYSNAFVSHKNSGQKSITQYGSIGSMFYLRGRSMLVPFVQAGYYHPISMQHSLINTKTQKLGISFGVMLR